MLQAMVVPEKTDNEIINDTIICPHCGSEMVRSTIDNPRTIHGRTYVCEVCGGEEIVSPPTEEEIY